MGVPTAVVCAARGLRSDLDRSVVRIAAWFAAIELAVFVYGLVQMIRNS